MATRPLAERKVANVTDGRARKRAKTAATVPAHEYPLPPELLAVEHEPEPQGRPWPARSCILKCWPEHINGERDVMISDVLKERGWTDMGGFCDPDHFGDLERVLKGRHPGFPLPRRAVWIPGEEYEVTCLHEAFSTDATTASRFRVTALPKTHLTSYKTYTAKALAAEPFVPTTFVLPAQRKALLATHETLLASSSKTGTLPPLWVGKPEWSYAGRGIVVSADVKELADGEGVVQRYIDRPLLIGGYKFHMRVYLLVTSLAPLRAYVHNDVHAMFATLPYVADETTLGAASFENRVHLTNYDINARPENLKAYLEDKPGVGRGCLWCARRLEAWLRAERPDISIDAMWRQIRLIGRAVARSIAHHPEVAAAQASLPFSQEVGHELFGIDVMLDADGKCWLLELNDSPGLEYCGSHLANGQPSPDAEEGDTTTRAVINDRFTLHGYDRELKKQEGDASHFLRVC
jgi:hypothetical protein